MAEKDTKSATGADPVIEPVTTGMIDVIVARGVLTVGYSGQPIMGKNQYGQDCIVQMGEPINKGVGERVSLELDEAHRLLKSGVVRLPATEGNLPAPPGAANGPTVGFTEGVKIASAA